jgi:dTDP-4-dehydrorhamnose reductase
MRILVTGASGLLGVNLALEAAKRHTVFGTTYTHGLKPETFTSIQTNLLADGAVEQIVDEVQPDWVINCAALAIVDSCENNPDLARQMNVELPRKLALYVARGGARLVHISTDAVFDGQRGNYTENDTPNPLSVYARTKLEGEWAVAEAYPQAILSRVNFFGWSLTGKRSLAEWFFHNLQAGKEMMGFTDIFFCPLLVNDMANILLEMLEQKLCGLYHVVSSQCVSKFEFGVALARQFGYNESLIQPTSVEQSNLLAPRSSRLSLRVDKLVRDLGRTPPDISSGLKRYFELHKIGYSDILRKMINKERSC